MTDIDTFRKGDHWVVDDRTGERIRASDSRTEWNGDVVHKDDFEERHPQELMRPRKDDQRPRGPVRPEEVTVFGGPLTTTLAANAAAGAVALQFTSTARFEAGDYIRIALDSQDIFRALLQTVPDAVNVTIIPPLPGAASAGNVVIDETALATVDIG